MKIPIKCKIEEVCFRIGKKLRKTIPPANMESVYFCKKENVVVATDGVAMVVVPVESTARETGGLIDAKDLRVKRRKCSQQAPTPDTVLAPKTEGSYKDYIKWKNVWRKHDPITLRVTLNPERLLELASAMGSEDSITLEFQESEEKEYLKAIVVRPASDKGVGKGLIMPMRATK